MTWFSAEAEYRGLANATIELAWIQSLLKELRISHHVPALLCDNQSDVAIAHNPVLHSRTKHLELDIHFVKERVLAKSLKVLHVIGSGQLADALTKPLSAPHFHDLNTKFKVISLPPLQLEGGVIGSAENDHKHKMSTSSGATKSSTVSSQ